MSAVPVSAVLTRMPPAAALAVVATLPLALSTGCDRPSVAGESPTSATDSGVNKGGAIYTDDGKLKRPDDHREWIFVGAPVTPNDMNNGSAAFPEFHNVYIDPISFAAYKRAGTFPNGTMIVKELVSVGGKSMASGNGYFQGEFVSLEAMVKDTQRFPDEPGGWAFFRFGEAPNYTATGAQMETASCNSCHAGATEDYVFTSTYPVLRDVKSRLTNP